MALRDGPSDAPIEPRTKRGASTYAERDMRPHTSSLQWFFFVALLALAGPLAAQAGPNDTCLMCHSDPAAKGSTGKSIGLAADKFKASVHGSLGLQCTNCHSDTSVDKLPHEPKLKPADCASCHESAVKEYDATVHGKAHEKGSQVAAFCQDCHGGAHEMLRASDPAARTHRTNIEATCASCHGDTEMAKKAQVPGGDVGTLYHDSIHGQLIHGDGPYSTLAPTCTSCHGAHSILGKSESASRVARANIPDTCGSCHQREKIVFDKGTHGTVRQAGNIAAPNCADCHSSHTIQRAATPAWQVAVIGQCGNCHDDLVRSYRLTYHGKVTNLGFANMATCASCHGAHEVLPASNPLSPIAPANRVEMCRNCHAGATARFATWDPHPEPGNRERSVVLYYTNIFMNVLLAGVFIFFGLHTVLWGIRSLRLVRERRRSGGHK